MSLARHCLSSLGFYTSSRTTSLGEDQGIADDERVTLGRLHCAAPQCHRPGKEEGQAAPADAAKHRLHHAAFAAPCSQTFRPRSLPEAEPYHAAHYLSARIANGCAIPGTYDLLVATGDGPETAARIQEPILFNRGSSSAGAGSKGSL